MGFVSMRTFGILMISVLYLMLFNMIANTLHNSLANSTNETYKTYIYSTNEKGIIKKTQLTLQCQFFGFIVVLVCCSIILP